MGIAREPGACLTCLFAVVLAVTAAGQGRLPSAADSARARLAILAAEDRRAVSSQDLATIRAGVRSADAQTARIAVRALGRLERPELIADIVPSLRYALPEMRAEAATAIGQAAQGWMREPASKAPRSSLEVGAAALTARLNVEGNPNVRAAIGETLGRLPYLAADQLRKAKQALLSLMRRSQAAADRLGVARGLAAIVRLHSKLRPPDTDLLDALRMLVSLSPNRSSVELVSRGAGAASDPAREARVRRLAIEALVDAEAADDVSMRRAASDPDEQVRRLAMRAAANPRVGSSDVAAAVLRDGLADLSPMVRVEALRAVHIGAAVPDAVGTGLQIGPEARQAGPAAPQINACAAAIAATQDRNTHVALLALDQLADCPSADAVSILEHAVNDVSRISAPRGWHRAAHAMVALAAASPERAAAALPSFTAARIWELRMYGARAAAALTDRPALDTLARDDDDNVKEAAIAGLAAVAGHDADTTYVAALAGGGYQVLRAAAAALEGTHEPAAVEALSGALHRLLVERRDNSRDARTRIADTLGGLGVAADAGPARAAIPGAGLSAADLRRLASARARVAVRGVGSFEMALLTSEAPASALRFARLALSGYYNGLTFHRVVPNFVIQGGSPGANEYIGDGSFMRDEIGQWPHVRGAVGISTRGHDTGDAQIFIDPVDNPRLDHEYTVFAHVLTGMEVVDAILEGDVIERVEMVLGS